MYLVPTICLCLCGALWSGHLEGWALVGRHERDGVLFHLNWKAVALHISSLFETIQGLSILLVKLKNNCSKIISCQLGMASGRGY